LTPKPEKKSGGAGSRSPTERRRSLPSAWAARPPRKKMRHVPSGGPPSAVKSCSRTRRLLNCFTPATSSESR
jgi:hypothetical protein